MKKILIVDEQEILRDGVKQVLAQEPHAVTFGEAGSVPEALKLARQQEWDIVLLGLSLGNRSGLDVLKKLKEMRPQLPVLIFSRYPPEQFASRALALGASGYITKNSPGTELVNAVNKVISGGRYLSPAVAEKLIFDRETRAGKLTHDDLSNREFEVLQLIAAGKAVHEIGAILSLSTSSISTYRGRILQKLGMKRTAELIHYAFQNNLVD